MSSKIKFSLFLGLTAAALNAQAPIASNGGPFTPGNIVVSRSVYTGDATTVGVGQALPPVCPATAACGKLATDSGAYPTTASTNNVWNNNKTDGSFGVTSPIFLDQLTPSGVAVSSLPVPIVSTSFSSKSELALNVSTDGSAITFMGYVAPPNTVDVSNSNTPGVYDPTNPAGGSYYRAVVQVNANGTIQITPTNAYSGNNGRAAVLSGGVYYMVGNSNNGTGTPTNVITSTGVQMASPGQSGATVPTQIGNFSITQLNDPTTGKPYAADKLGKDNNFRGLTIFNNTLYVTKGSGSNGVDTVYQVGLSGGLPNWANAASAPINVLPGFPTVLAKNVGANDNYPFGIWFANATTLYVADEGDGVLADIMTSPSVGLQKWVLTNGVWNRVYVMKNGLNLGQPYSVANYPTSITPATGGLRNITGRVNNDGTVTIYAVTATVSSNGDQGADPNLLVAINDVLANTDPSVAAKQQFTVLKAAKAGEVLRGVSLAPAQGTSSPQNTPLILSGGSAGVQTLAPGGLAFALGQGLATGTAGPLSSAPPTIFSGTQITIRNYAGSTWPAPLVFVSPTQITFQVPASVPPGPAQIQVTSPASAQWTANTYITSPAPALFTVNGLGLPAAYSTTTTPSGPNVQPVWTVANGVYSAVPISISGATYLTLYGTGFQGGITTATVNGVNANVTYAGASGYVGVDQINLVLPASVAGKGTVPVQLTSSGVAANTVAVVIK